MLLFYFIILTSYKISEKSHEQSLSNLKTEGRIEGQMDERTGGLSRTPSCNLCVQYKSHLGKTYIILKVNFTIYILNHTQISELVQIS